MIRGLTDYVWPTLAPMTVVERQSAATELTQDLAAIEACSFGASAGLALEAARKLAEDEEERRLGAEARASTYLLVIAAIIPLLTYLEGTVWGQTFGQAPRWLSVAVLGVAILYLLGAGRWAFWTLGVAAYDRIDAQDLVALVEQDQSTFEEALSRKILAVTRRNRDAVNRKVTGIKMCHLFLKFAVRWFGLLLLLQIVWYLGSLLIPKALALACPIA
ncbi:MAG: hypothetical protein PGN33_10295 [Methylobacterium radiotolerans]